MVTAEPSSSNSVRLDIKSSVGPWILLVRARPIDSQSNLNRPSYIVEPRICLIEHGWVLLRATQAPVHLEFALTAQGPKQNPDKDLGNIHSAITENQRQNKMFPRWIVYALLSLQTTAASTPDSASACMESVSLDTISMFSHAPLTFSFEIPSASACAEKCAGLTSCRAWLYSTSGQECQLYRDQPLLRAKNPLFVSGSCEKVSLSSSSESSSVSVSRIKSFEVFLPCASC